MNIEKTEEIAAMLAESKCCELTVSDGETTIHVKKAAVPAAEAKEVPRKPQAEADKISEVKADLVGIFTFAKAFAAGDTIEKDQLVGRIKAFSIVNEILSPCSGTVAEILCDDKSPVEYGQAVMTVRE